MNGGDAGLDGGGQPMLDGGPTDAGRDAALPQFDAGASHCAVLALLPCEGTTRTVMGRDYCIHVPPGYHDGTNVPLVLLLHGYSADGPSQAAYLGMDRLSDARTFLLVTPNGLQDDVGLRYWNASPACCSMFAGGSPPDDVAFLMAVLDDVESAYSIDTTREYVMGHSNGGFMTHRMLCEHGDRFGAGASLAGAVNPDCTPATPVSVLEVHGDNDATISYTGGTNPGASTPYPSVDDTLAYWAAADGCTGELREIEVREDVCDLVDNETHVMRYPDCGAVTVEHWRIQGGGHVPLFHEPDWPGRVIDFLFAHRR